MTADDPASEPTARAASVPSAGGVGGCQCGCMRSTRSAEMRNRADARAGQGDSCVGGLRKCRPKDVPSTLWAVFGSSVIRAVFGRRDPPRTPATSWVSRYGQHRGPSGRPDSELSHLREVSRQRCGMPAGVGSDDDCRGDHSNDSHGGKPVNIGSEHPSHHASVHGPQPTPCGDMWKWRSTKKMTRESSKRRTTLTHRDRRHDMSRRYGQDALR
jgi:hypothetical protein